MEDRTSDQPLVKAEEIGIVAVVLLLWVAAIALFINRWGKIRSMEPYHPYFEPEEANPAAPIDNGGTNSHRPSLFEAAVATSRRLSNVSGSYAFYPPAPTLALPPGSDRRLSVFSPQPPSIRTSRRASCYLYPELAPQLTSSSLLAPKAASSSRRTSVCTAAEYLMRTPFSPNVNSKLLQGSSKSLFTGTNSRKTSMAGMLVPEVRCTLPSPDSVTRRSSSNSAQEQQQKIEKNESQPSQLPMAEKDEKKAENQSAKAKSDDVEKPLCNTSAKKRREAFKSYSMKQSEV